MKLSIKKLPLISMLVAIVLAIGLILFIGTYSKEGVFGARETIIDNQNKDTDGDGLKDWEEELYKTDPLNPDTDGDGYIDGEEINSGHNPLVKAPNDKQVFFPLPLGEKYNITNKIFSNTDTIFKAYLEQKDEYIRDHPEIDSPEEYLAQTSQSTFNELFRRAILNNEENWLEQAYQILDEMPEIFNVQVSDDNIKISEQAVDYENKLMAYLTSPNFFLQERNFILLQESLPKENFSEIDAIIKTNNYEINKLRETLVPPAWKEIHKKTLKLSFITRNIFVSIRGYYSDPVKTLIATDKIKDVLREWKILEQEINNLNQ